MEAATLNRPDVSAAELPGQREASEKKPPIEDTGRGIRFLGVEMLKAENPDHSDPLILDPADYDNLVHGETALQIQQAIAIGATGGLPTELIGGSGLGKSKLTKEMAAKLGYKMYDMTFSKRTRARDLIETYVQNPNRKSANDPEFILSDGILIQALTTEDGQRKMFLGDELSAMQPGERKELNDIISRYIANGYIEICNPDDPTGPKIRRKIDNTRTTLVFTSNPADEKQGYLGAFPSSIDATSRMNRIVLPRQLSPEDDDFALEYDIDPSAPQDKPMPESAFLYPNPRLLTKAELAEIPGYQETMREYGEFHKKIKEMLRRQDLQPRQNGEVIDFGGNQPRINTLTFMARFLPPDRKDLVVPTLQKALQVHYLNRWEEGPSRDIVLGMIDAIGKDLSETTASGNYRDRLWNEPDMEDDAPEDLTTAA
jgi:AAA domain (dynein-related subfamily)